MMKIMVGCDHGGYELKEKLVVHLRQQGHQVEDIGAHSLDSVDYPEYAVKVGRAVAGGAVERGILVCGSGIGMCIAANRIPGVRAVQANEPYAAKMARRHNDSNVLCLGGRFLGPGLAAEVVDVWLAEAFEGGRHQKRVEMIDHCDGDAGVTGGSPFKG
ncbi:ribose 5-phosphate isomerase B [Syntrophobacteraceae bacterium DRH4]|nr:ribose 5-phosphate isomerase B [Desulfoferrobacter suflitae]